MRQLSGRYVNREMGGVIVFHADGKFFYAFTTPTEELPRNAGHYHFEHAADAVPALSVRSAHAGQFSIRVADTGDQVFVANRAISSGEQKYERQ